MTFDDATLAQISAADPNASTWLAANAGSGKTRVLTDRVARLLLQEVQPQHILCLTYTKAAASEMQNRLFKRLGGWAMLDDDALRAEMAELGVEGDLGADALRRARIGTVFLIPSFRSSKYAGMLLELCPEAHADAAEIAEGDEPPAQAGQ